MSEVLHYLRSTLLPEGADLTDGQLLECFVSRREPAALEGLVRRHGPMVWGVCRRILQNHHEAEDAFQATFLVLVRRASSIRCRAKVGNWLYGVAHQTALKARANRAKRKSREAQVIDMPEPVAAEQDSWSDLQPVLDQELSRLPERYRTVIVLCDLEGRSGKEASRQLGLPQGTVASRLARAREMLGKRLARHGLSVSGGTLAAVLSEKSATAAVPGSVMASTIKVVTRVAAGQAAAGVVSDTVAALAEGVLKAMLLTKLKIAASLVLVFAILGAGASRLLLETQAATPAVTDQGGDKETPPENPALAKLQGTWVAVAAEANGKEVSEKLIKEAKVTLVIAGDKFVASATNLVGMNGKVTWTGIIKVNSSKRPPWFDLLDNLVEITKTKSALKTTGAKGLYELRDDSLKVCYGPERPAQFKTAPNSSQKLYVFERRKAKPNPDATQQRNETDIARLQGTWRLVASEVDGLTFGEGRAEIKDSFVIFKDSSVTMMGKLIHSPRIKKEPEDVKAVGTFTLDTKKIPKVIVFTWESNPWLSKEHLREQAIYAFDRDRLELCSYFPGEDTRLLLPTEFSANAGSKRSVATWKRVLPAEKGGEKTPQESETQKKGDKQIKSALPNEIQADQARAAEDRAKLQGTWQLVTLETDGLKVGEGRPELKEDRLVIEQQSLTLFATPGSEHAEPVKAVASFTLDAGRTPKVIVLTWKECPWNRQKDFVSKAIYSIDGDQLKLCLTRNDNDQEAPTEFSARTGSERILWTFKRVSPSGKLVPAKLE
jgi:RNA polymerase sigma factor (sigma-70 family)